MFCPPDYVSLAQLWKDFHSEFRTALLRVAVKEIGREDFGTPDIFGSPDDLCEDVFLSTFDEFAMFAAQSDGRVMRLDVVLDGGRSKLFEKMSAFESYKAASDPSEAGEDGFWLRKLGSDHFEARNASLGTLKEWKSRYGDFEAANKTPVCFHTLPLVFERARFVIADQSPPWLEDVIDEHFLPSIVERFAGWSLCLDRKSAEDWRRDVMVKKQFVQRNPTPAPYKDRGRPRKIELIIGAYLELYPDGHTGALKTVRADIEENFGIEFSVKSLSRAIAEIKKRQDKNPD